MALKPEELLAIAPDAAKLAELLHKALQKDDDWKVRVTPGEGKAIKQLLTKLALQLAKDAVD